MQASSQEGSTIGELSVRKSATTSASPGKVWAAIGDFSGIARWHPVVASAVVEERDGDTVRVLTLNGGGTIVERLVDWNDTERSYTYAIVESPLPVDRYVSTLSVSPDGAGSRIDWNGTFDAKGASHDEATGVISGIYESGLAAIVEAASA